MKKAIFAVLLCMIGCHAFSQINMVMKAIQIQWSVRYEQPVGNGNPVPRSPIVEPEVTLDGHTLTFDSSCHGLTLQLVNADDEVEYSTVITSDTLVLPSTLEGEYEIRIVCGNYYFYGSIEL